MEAVGETVWFEFVESKAFSKQVRELSREILANIQSDLVQNPEPGAIVKGTHGVRKAEWQIRRRRAGRAEVIDTCIFTSNTPGEFTCRICAAKASRLICRRSRSKLSER